MEQRKQILLETLRAFARQRPGLEFANYGSASSYRSEARSIQRDLQDAETLLSAVGWRDSITADDLLKAQSAYSGRLSIKETTPGRFELDYCTGQYWPTEYRKAVCAVLASALWDYARGNTATPELAGGKAFRGSPGDLIRSYFRREFGARMQKRWFD